VFPIAGGSVYSPIHSRRIFLRGASGFIVRSCLREKREAKEANAGRSHQDRFCRGEAVASSYARKSLLIKCKQTREFSRSRRKEILLKSRIRPRCGVSLVAVDLASIRATNVDGSMLPRRRRSRYPVMVGKGKKCAPYPSSTLPVHREPPRRVSRRKR